MTLRWSAPTQPAFDPMVNKVRVSAQKDLGDDTYVTMSFEVGIGWEGPRPTEDDVLRYLGLLYGALANDGWESQLDFVETTTVTRRIEQAEEV
ncbi:hypothetical protein [Streptomyces sp. MJP52]|uniref:hypothetical protein n=1 Tax=Streptomyces sp. MJP52 TaxID=2940555 RepID=UPI0024770C89|nr:hypothetical protein [Streptomyces sp. MJP52]MDH6224369.1 hypothetical protein [Streptomyces sp. MJP52]